MNAKSWVHTDEWFVWFPCSDEDANRPCTRLGDKTFAETFPNQYKHIPAELAERLRVAVETLRAVENEIDALEVEA
jgi:hypothetical protein